MLKAEVDHLQNVLQSDKEEKEIVKAGKIEARKDELYKLQLERCRKQRDKIKQLIHQRNDLIAKLCTLEKHKEPNGCATN
jgi:hypothetical protein